MITLEAKKGTEELIQETSTTEFKSPVQITFIMEEELYEKLLKVAHFFKETPREVLCELCENAERFMTY